MMQFSRIPLMFDKSIMKLLVSKCQPRMLCHCNVNKNLLFLDDNIISSKLNSLANSKLNRYLSTRSFVNKNSQTRKDTVSSLQNEELNEEFAEIFEDEEYEDFVSKSGGSFFGFSSIAVIQPWIKWGRKKKHYTSPELLLDEACALIKSLPSITVPYRDYVTLEAISKSIIFGKGNLERLLVEIKSSFAEALFISVENLSRVQKRNLEDHFGMKVFDRYSVVLAIFRHYARTTEAKLQIAMAELPSMRKHVITETDRMLIHRREAKLRKALKKLSVHRGRVRETRKKSSISSIAVVGYTNSGKTTLIRALTGDQRAEGQNRLFATLDVTAHKGHLPCGINVLYVDTVGFIQDIPTGLIASFQATLEDAICADVIVHIRDISHPDIVAQTKSVEETLAALSVPEKTPIILVNNKADLLEEKLEKSTSEVNSSDPLYKEGFYVSSIKGAGLSGMLKKLESELIEATEREMHLLRLPIGSLQIDWLKKCIGIASEEVDDDDQNIAKIHVVMNEAQKALFRRVFRDT